MTSSPQNWVLHVDPHVFGVMKRIPRRDAEAILAVIRFLPFNPYFGDIQKMNGEQHDWRRRIGAYRLFYRIKIAEKVVLVFRLERRTSKTY